ncbi:MAG TPA: Stk1 family PASTA domain-containing Ser/Thr kinase [Gaiellaceae bacterium]|jgi:serine/threonine-protein kinase|nr:Stk1 family PASTA domain-containing Ser/Thr kinase [Gaiellaceae bacterium]
MSTSDTLINTLFDGRYRIVRKLGSGGMANVYLAEDEDLGRRVAIKILNERYANDDLFIERFRREAKSAAALSHPNIVSVYDRGEAEGTYYIAMEVIEGRSLKELIMTRGPLPIPQALAYSHEILEALRFAHRHGIIHRDIKPHNILIGERLKVTDFGIARAGASQMTEAGSIMGTAQYLSPEQARGAPVTASSDLYSVGIVLYEMLTGKVPFTGDSAIEIAMKHLNEAPKPPSKIRPEIPDALDQVVLRALSKNPEDRYQTAEEFSEDLHRVEAGLPLSPETSEAATALLAGAALAGDGGSTEVLAGTAVTRPQGPPPPTARTPPPYGPGYYEEPPRKRRRWGPWLLVALLLAAAGIAGWYVFSQIQDQLAANEPIGVPNVVGLKEEAAVSLIESKGLVPDVQRAANPDVEKGRVFDQNPNAGNRIQKGDRVTLLVSAGPPKTSVPDVTGMNYGDAVQALNDANLNASKHEVFSPKPAGQVVDQNPPAGEQVVEGTEVVLDVSKGTKQVEVPNVVGMSEAEARTTLEQAGFKVSSTSAPSDTTPQGDVSDQNPDGGTQAAKGSTVAITVSSGPSTTTVPDEIGQDKQVAIDDLKANGFKVHAENVACSDPNQDNIVQDQDPAGGSDAPNGSTVNIFVCKF